MAPTHSRDRPLQGLWAEKSQPYEETVHIPFIVRGPGIAANATRSAIVSSIDIAATILELGGVSSPGAARSTDGRSLVPLLMQTDGVAPPANWTRDRALIEFFGWPSDQMLGPCQQGAAFPVPRVVCPEPPGTPIPVIDAPSNVFSALRIINASHDMLYAEYRPAANTPIAPASTNWTECYNLCVCAVVVHVVSVSVSQLLPPQMSHTYHLILLSRLQDG